MEHLVLAKRYSDAFKAANEALQLIKKAKEVLGGKNKNINIMLQNIEGAIESAKRDIAHQFDIIEDGVKVGLLDLVTSALKEMRPLAEVADTIEAMDYISLQAINPSATA